jgi:hypothetical protein
LKPVLDEIEIRGDGILATDPPVVVIVRLDGRDHAVAPPDLENTLGAAAVDAATSV